MTQSEAGFRNYCVIPRFDEAIGDADVMATIGIDSIAIAVENGHSFDIYEIAAQQADIVIRRIADRYVPHGNMAAILYRDWFCPATFVAVSIDCPLPSHPEVL